MQISNYPVGHDIYWAKWVDAYDNDEHDKWKNDQIDDADEYRDSDGDIDYLQGEELSVFDQPIKSIMTPFGLLPLTEHSQASKHFKFWVGHTNFRLNKKHLNMISQCDGVETVDKLTRYRFRIGIGYLFKDRDVMTLIKNTLVPSNGKEKQS